jgi:hypothetical protein
VWDLRIYRVLKVRSSRGELNVKALFDARASFTVIRRDVERRSATSFQPM